MLPEGRGVAHPFFGSAGFPWHRPDAREFLAVLPNIARDPREIALIYESVAPGLPFLTPAAPLLLWREALQNLALANALNALCDRLLERRLHPSVVAAIEAVRHAEHSVDQLIRDADTSLVILDRAALRLRIKRLASNDSPLKVIVVRGDPGSGKSHCRHLFELAGRDHNARVVYLSADMIATVDEVIEELFGVLKAIDKIPPAGETTGSAYHSNVWRRLREIADSEQQPLWIAVDDLGTDEDGAPLLDPQIREFFDQLVLKLPSPQYRDWFRLMLIHYPEGNFPTKWRREVFAENRTAVEDVNAEHVADALRYWSARHGRTVVEQDIEALAENIVRTSENAGDEDGGDCRLQRLHDLVSETLESLAS